MNKLLIIDGHNLLFQMFFGMPARIVNKEGIAIHAVIGFVGAVNKMIAATQSTHVLAIFDGETANPRKSIDENYKSNRKDYSAVDDVSNPFSQLQFVYDALDEMGIVHAETTDSEADDVIAVYASQADESFPLVIASHDSDFFQLVNTNVSILLYRGKNSITVDEKYILEKYGILPQNYALFKSLTGDKADNIAGISGIGQKTAASLTCDVTTPDQLFEKCRNLQGNAAQRVLQNRAKVLTNYSLIKPSDTTAIPFKATNLPPLHEQRKTTEIIRAIGL